MLEILGKIGFDWQVALANLVNFIIIFFVLRKFAWGPIQKVIKERQDKIDKGLEDAEKARTDLLMAEQVKTTKIKEAKEEANEIVGSAQGKADAILEKNKNEAILLKEGIIKDGQKVIDEKTLAINKEVEKQTAQLILQGVEKVLKENMTVEMQKSYIEKSLSSLNTK